VFTHFRHINKTAFAVSYDIACWCVAPNPTGCAGEMKINPQDIRIDCKGD